MHIERMMEPDEWHLKRYEFAAGFAPDRSVLDAACGAGYGSHMMMQAGAASVLGVDISEDAIAHASREVSLTLTALECALAARRIEPGVIHHSDQGVQYAAGDYVARAREAGMVLSMSRRGRPRDNPRAESFFRTLKVEQVYLSEYEDFDDAYRQIGHFIDEVYNRKRLHSSLGYLPPIEFEAGIALEEKEEGHPGRLTVGVPVPEPPLAPAAT